MTDNELTDATARTHSLFVGVAEMDASQTRALMTSSIPWVNLNEMIEGRMSRAVRDHRHSGFVTE